MWDEIKKTRVTTHCTYLPIWDVENIIRLYNFKELTRMRYDALQEPWNLSSSTLFLISCLHIYFELICLISCLFLRFCKRVHIRSHDKSLKIPKG